MKELSLQPYNGSIALCSSIEEMQSIFTKRTGAPWPYGETGGGRYVKLDFDDQRKILWLVYADCTATLAHEFSHVLLKTFKFIGHDPCEGDGEPYCWMLSYLLEAATSATTGRRQRPGRHKQSDPAPSAAAGHEPAAR